MLEIKRGKPRGHPSDSTTHDRTFLIYLPPDLAARYLSHDIHSWKWILSGNYKVSTNLPE